jgi:hypothetical protein
MDGCVEKDLRNLGVVNWKTEARAGWLEKVFRTGQDPQRIVVPIIIITTTTIMRGQSK